MKRDKVTASGAADLRRRAEERVRKKKTKTGLPLKEEDARKLLHELQVHQIELELQNEELRQAKEEIETALQKYTDLYDFSPVGYFTLDDKGVIREANLTGAVLLGTERVRLVNHLFGLFVSKDARPAFHAHLRKVFVEKTKEACQVALSQKGDRPRFVHIEIKPSESEQECRMVVMDITERKQAEEEREKLLRDLQKAMTEVKRLKGILPICASCKKIRDDQGYWNEVEVYIRDHSEAEFSHGICPECRQKLYPEFDWKKNEIAIREPK